jgi:hypothetical protein
VKADKLEKSSIATEKGGLPKIKPITIKLSNGVNLTILPSVHNSLLFTQAVSEIFGNFIVNKIKLNLANHKKQTQFLIELPKSLQNRFEQAVDRFPYLSVIHPYDADKLTQESLRLSYIVHPGDSLYWALYLARINNFQYHLLDTLTDTPPDYTLSVSSTELSFLTWDEIFENIDYKESSHEIRSEILSNRIIEILVNNDNSSTNYVTNYVVIVGLWHYPFIIKELNSNGFLDRTKNTYLGNFDLISNKNNENNILHENLETNPSKINNVLEREALLAVDYIISDFHVTSLQYITEDWPYSVGYYIESYLEQNLNLNYDFSEIIRSLFTEANKEYNKMFKISLSIGSLKKAFQYLRNLNKIQYNIMPSLIDTITVAKAMEGDDYAYELYKLLVSYPFKPNENDKLDKILKIKPEEIDRQTMKLTFKRRFPRPILQKDFKKNIEEDFDSIPEELYPGHWKQIWEEYSPFGTVSYPPEDEYIENYFHYLRKRAQEIINEEQALSEKFSTSLEDGIDWVNTIRNYYEKQIYVKKIPKKKDELGALIVQFEENPGSVYSHHSVLYAEHKLESDISILSTNPGDTLIGPGITRINLAAVVSVFPPEGYGVQIAHGLDDLKTKLLLTAMNMARAKLIVMISPNPPTPNQKFLVTSSGFRLLYLPMEHLSKASLKRLRTFHLLAHRDLRDIAREYIGY